MDVRTLLAVLVGGAIGTLARVGLAEGAPHTTGGWPWATLAVNLVGAALLAVLVVRLHERTRLAPYARPLLTTGLCGGLTTFSSLQLELLQMLDAGRVGLAALYVAVSLGLGLAAVAVATRLARRGART